MIGSYKYKYSLPPSYHFLYQISHLHTLLPFLPATCAVVTTEIHVPTALVTLSGVMILICF